MVIITANQPHVTNLPVHVRCSSQPMGLRSSFPRNHRWKKESANLGVQNTRFHHSWTREGGSSRQLRATFQPAMTPASKRTITETNKA